MSLRTQYHRYLNPLTSSDGRIDYYNWWNKQPADEVWFTTYLQKRGFLNRPQDPHFVFYSSLGSINLLRIEQWLSWCKHRRIRIYFNGENNHYPGFIDYKDNLLDHRSIDLSLGFDYTDDPRYMRFPLWILEMFPPESTEKDIRRICDQLSHQHLEASRNRFCALVSGNRGPDDPGAILRSNMVQQLNTIDTVDCAGKLLHNTDELKTKFNDNKAEFLKQYRFYICPENASVEGYVTEKLFHCMGSGCIPIYWGACSNPEPDILNRDAILFWNPDGDNNALLQQISDLQHNPQRYKGFFEQPRLKNDAWLTVAGYFAELEKRLHNLLR